MCHFKSWYCDEHGYVIECEQCRHFQVCFGTTMLTLPETDYQALIELVQKKKEDYVPMQDPNIRCVVLPTPCNMVHAVLSGRELEQLHTMLQEVDTEMKATQLLELFKA